MFGVSRAFTTAVSLGVFSVLEDLTAGSPAGATAADLGRAMHLNGTLRGATDLFDLCVAIGVLERTGDGPDALYRNTPAGRRHLVEASPDYVGGLAMVNHTRSYLQFVRLEEALRAPPSAPRAEPCAAAAPTPAAVAASVPHIRAVFSGEDEAAARDFALGMTGASLGPFRALAQRFGFERFSSLGDIGGSAGVLCACVASAHPHMRCTTYDLPKLHATAQAYTLAQGVQDRVTVSDLDFFAEAPFPPGHDVITMSMILHDWGLDRKRELMDKAYAALPPGGAFVAVDTIIDDARRTNIMGLYMSLNMLLEFGAENAFDYTFAEFRGWARAAGFRSTQLLVLDGPTSAAVAYK